MASKNFRMTNLDLLIEEVMKPICGLVKKDNARIERLVMQEVMAAWDRGLLFFYLPEALEKRNWKRHKEEFLEILHARIQNSIKLRQDEPWMAIRIVRLDEHCGLDIDLAIKAVNNCYDNGCLIRIDEDCLDNKYESIYTSCFDAEFWAEYNRLKETCN